MMIPVLPVKPVVPCICGKTLLAKRIIDRLDDISHTSYAEPFIGMDGIFLHAVSDYHLYQIQSVNQNRARCLD